MLTIDLNTARLKNLIIHFAGNKNNGEALQLSDTELELDDEMAQQLADGFLSRFKNLPEKFAFSHSSSLQYNEVYNYCKALFVDPQNFAEAASDIARKLYDASVHPKVKGGEFYVASFEGVPVESRLHKAIGLFKTENKALFLETKRKRSAVTLSMEEGVEFSKIDKGCLIINRDEEEGYEVFLFDNQNRGEEAQYWKEGFLGVAPQKNEFHHTAHILTLTKQFITEGLEGEADVSKTDQVALLHKSLNYFREKDAFDIEEFQSEVFGDEDMIQSFRQFGTRYVESNDYDIASNFDISLDAVKKQARVYKSVLKLDKNFHIYIHGRTDLIERGTDDDGRKYYKIYYQDEA